MTAVVSARRRPSRSFDAEARARARKATLIALMLAGRGVDSGTAEHFDHEGKTAAAGLADVRYPSPTTWCAVVGSLQAIEQRRAAHAVNTEALTA